MKHGGVKSGQTNRALLTGPLLLLLAGLLIPAFPCRGQEVKSIQTRPGVTLRFLFHQPETAAKGVMVMFPGGEGAQMFQEVGGQIVLGKNFLVRTSPEFVKKGFAVAIVDVPSDKASGMSPGFRNSPQHVLDIGRLVDFLGGQGMGPLFLVGTSMGTLSVAYLGTQLKDTRVKGLILTATVAVPEYVGGLRLGGIGVPVLLVHHQDDGCRFSPFMDAWQLKNKLSGSPKVDFVRVQGGSPPKSGPCNPLSYHGFWGMENQVVQVMTDWASGSGIPAQVGP